MKKPKSKPDFVNPRVRVVDFRSGGQYKRFMPFIGIHKTHGRIHKCPLCKQPFFQNPPDGEASAENHWVAYGKKYGLVEPIPALLMYRVEIKNER